MSRLKRAYATGCKGAVAPSDFKLEHEQAGPRAEEDLAQL